MAKVFIVGAAGKVGGRLARLLAAKGHEARALHRKAEQAGPLAEAGALPLQGDLATLDADGLAALVGDADTIVFSAGAGGAGIAVTNAIDGRGLELAVAAGKRAGVRRFLLVSVFPDALRDGERNEGFENYIRVKKLADAYLVASGLDYVIVRPGTLSDRPGNGRVLADSAIPYGIVPRDDVAATLLGLVERPAISRAIIELTAGDMPIAAALDRLATR